MSPISPISKLNGQNEIRNAKRASIRPNAHSIWRVETSGMAKNKRKHTPKLMTLRSPIISARSLCGRICERDPAWRVIAMMVLLCSGERMGKT